MPTEVILPRVDMDMAEGRIAHWYVKEGEPVRKGQTIFEIETDKATMEVDATADGVMHGIRGEIGVAIPVGEVVGWILAPGEASPGIPPAQPAASTAGAGAAAVPPDEVRATLREAAARPGVAAGAGLLRATPLARQLAREHGIDLGAVAGSGPNGRVLGGDLLAAREAGATASAAPPDPIHLQWMQRGNGAPLLLIHGFGADHAAWRPLLQQLPAGLPVIGIDLPGHGKSAARPATTLQALAAPLLERLDREGVVDFHLLGHSLGGGVALVLAAMAVGRARSLTLLAPVGLGPDIHAGFIDGLLRATDEATLKPVLAELFHRPALLTGSFVATAFQQLRSPERRAALTDLARHLLPQGRQAQGLRSTLGGLTVPVQLIWGIADRIIPMQHALDVAPQVGLHFLPSVGHLPQVEAAGLVGLLATHLLREATPR